MRIRYRTRTRKTRDPKPAGFPEPVPNPIQHIVIGRSSADLARKNQKIDPLPTRSNNWSCLLQ